MDIVKQKLKDALETQNYRIYCEIFEELSEEEISRLARLYNIDPASPRRIICEKLVEVLKSKFISLPNEIINKIMMHSSSEDIERWKDFDRMHERTYLKKKNSTLREAAGEGNVVGMEYLLENGADLEKEGTGALREAAINGHLDAVIYLIEKGVYIEGDDDSDDDDDELIYKVAEKGHLNVIKYLLENDIDVHKEFLISSAMNHMDVVNYLLDKWKDERIDYSRIYRNNVTEYTTKEFIDALVKRGADINADSGSQMIYAISNNNEELIDYLLEKGANVYLALEEAVDTDYADAVKYLVDKGVVDYMQLSMILIYAIMNKATDTINYLKTIH
jgi:ankyrin repeat protein